jgi:formate-dependent nitrite reductase cytochrome c552 subunit
MEDNFDVPMSNVVQAKLMQAQQLVPYINAQKYVQTHQARVVANLVVDTFSRAGKGDQKAVEVLAGYAIQSEEIEKRREEAKRGG